MPLALDLSALVVIASCFLIGLVRPLVLKPCANMLRPSENALLGAVFITLASVFLLPWFWVAALPSSTLSPATWATYAAISFAKGVVWWRQFIAFQATQKESASTAAVLMVLGFVLIGVVNSFFGETLHWNQWLAMLGVLAVTIAFYRFGHARTLSAQGRRAGVWMTVLLIPQGLADYLVLSHVHWYQHLVFIALGMCTCVCFAGATWASLRKILAHQVTRKAVVVLALTEVLMMNLLVTHIPVAIYGIVARAAVPFVMVLAAYLWGEGDWRRQLLFGLLSWACLWPLLWGL